MPESIRINFVTGAPRRYVADVEALAGAPARLEAAAAGQSAAWMRAPLEGGLSPARVIGAMIEHARQTRENLVRMAWMTDPMLVAPPEGTPNDVHSWEARDPSRLLGWFAEAVSEAVDLLKELPDSSWGRPGQTPIHGRRSIRQTVRDAADHYEAEVAKLVAARQ